MDIAYQDYIHVTVTIMEGLESPDRHPMVRLETICGVASPVFYWVWIDELVNLSAPGHIFWCLYKKSLPLHEFLIQSTTEWTINS